MRKKRTKPYTEPTKEQIKQWELEFNSQIERLKKEFGDNWMYYVIIGG